ncbi:hypothetical protein ACFQY0_14995 [Haloferula chungangensis]|uniref:Prepilin-type N-terminal cleavage/methylation domain-containing protein n=1 Tax=Haloferula chungangensis TaxID=1048331 RepID=A0ABW2LA64_9BACT
MKAARHRSGFASGISLVETIVSVGVLAVVIPLAMAAMLKASGTGASARAETRATAIADYCLLELRAARKGNSAYFSPVKAGESFGSAGKLMALGFGRDGAVLGVLTQAQYDQGLVKLDDDQVYYLAKLSGELDTTSREVDLVTVAVAVEYPASKAASKRSQVIFHTKLP